MQHSKIALAIIGLALVFQPNFAAAQGNMRYFLGSEFLSARDSPLIDPDTVDGIRTLEVICTDGDDHVTITFQNHDEVNISVRRAGETDVWRQRTVDVESLDHIAVATFDGEDEIVVNVAPQFSIEIMNRILDRDEAFSIYCELGPGNDLFDGAASPFECHVHGGNGLDTLTGGPNEDWLRGNPMLFDGFTTFYATGDGFQDWITGNGGDDYLDGEYVLGGEGDDVIISSEEGNIYTTASSPPRYALIAYAGNGDDIIYGTPGTDYIFGQGDDDEIFGNGGADYLSGGSDNDDIYSLFYSSHSDAGDMMWGGTGNDKLFGGPGDDMMWGGSDNDELWGGNGIDKLMGQTGDDTLCGSSLENFAPDGDEDYLEGGQDNDSFITWYTYTFDRVLRRNDEERPVDLDSGEVWQRIVYWSNFGGFRF